MSLALASDGSILELAETDSDMGAAPGVSSQNPPLYVPYYQNLAT